MAQAEVILDFAGTPVPARIGESIAAALTRAGLYSLGCRPDGSARGVFCGMGVCQDCVLAVDGVAGRCCTTTVSGPHRLGPTGDPSTGAPLPPIDIEDVPLRTPEVLVVGGGAAGLAAATAAAQAGAAVVLLDERARLGGQYFKQPSGWDGWRDDAQFAGGRALIDAARAAGVRLVQAEVWAALPPRELAVLGAEGMATFRPARLIVATGAFERGLAFPGWTLPGVMTTGAAQTLLRGEGVVAGRRVLVAGNGPLNLQVAVELARHGAEVTAVVEAAPSPGLAQAAALWRMGLSAPDLLRRGVALDFERRRRRIPLLHGQMLRRVEPAPGGLTAQVSPQGNGLGARFTVDVVCIGYGFQPANEILRLLGCEHAFDAARDQLVTVRDGDGATSIGGVYAAGDCCGLAGAAAAIDEGRLAGWAAAASLGHGAGGGAVEAARRRLARQRRFQSGLWRLYAAPSAALEAEVPICRCEGVRLEAVQAAIGDGRPSIGEVKQRTRLGMGPCQGRYCAPPLAAMLARRDGCAIGEFALFAPQPPVKPVSIAALSRPSARGDAD